MEINTFVKDLSALNIAVTGGAGFIGSHIVDELVKRGANVTVIDNLSFGKLENLKGVINKINFIKGDLRDYETVKNAFKGIDYVSHQGALRSVFVSIEDPQQYNEVNILGHFNVLKAAKENNIKRVVFASSSSIYGDNNNFPLKEEFTPNPKSPYALTKLVGEKYCKLFCDLYGLETVNLRYFNVFGERQDQKSQYAAVIAVFIRRILDGQKPTIYGDGLQSRDFTYIANNVHANILAFFAKNIAGETINIADNSSISLIQLIDKINKHLGKDIKPEFAPARPGDIKKTQGDNTKAKLLLDYKPLYSFDEGLIKTIDYLK
ncbi:MAG: SDR family oxidoreductase [Candidatus Woesearchaeota archaeon]|nr:MAG: SDR family oxidoreductase [Candidatus Woesearchaeota archaeon]